MTNNQSGASAVKSNGIGKTGLTRFIHQEGFRGIIPLLRHCRLLIRGWGGQANDFAFTVGGKQTGTTATDTDTISDFDISETFNAFNTVQKLAPVAENCDGKFSCDIKFNSILNEQMEPELNTINSSGILKTKNIVITNSNIFNKIADALKMTRFKNFNFNDIEIFFTIKDGKITLEPFETKFDNLKAMIGGSQGIDQSLDYIMNFEIPRSEFGGKANDVLNNLVSQAVNKGVGVELGEIVNVDVLVGGTVSEPVIKLNLQEQAKDIYEDLKVQVKDEIDKQKQEALKKAKEQADRLIAVADAKAQQILKAAEKTAKQIKALAKKSADKLRSEANSEAAQLIKKAGSNPIAKKAAKIAGDKLKKEAEIKAKKIESEAAKQADNTIAKARKEADAIKKKAQQDAQRIINQAN